MLKLYRLERECFSAKNQMKEVIEEKKKVIIDLSARLRNAEKSCRELQSDLEMVRQKSLWHSLEFFKHTLNIIGICWAELWYKSDFPLL